MERITMRRPKLLVSATAIVALGAVSLLHTPAVANANVLECYVCVPPPIMCVDPDEFTGPCRTACGPNAHALTCPYIDDDLCGQLNWKVDCTEG